MRSLALGLLLASNLLVGCAAVERLQRGIVSPTVLTQTVEAAKQGNAAAGPVGALSLGLAVFFAAAWKAGKKEPSQKVV